LVRRVFQLERSGASLLCVVAPVRLDNPNVVIDVMTRNKELYGTTEVMT